MHFQKNYRGYICGIYNKYCINACSCHLIREADLILLNNIKNIASILDIHEILNALKTKLKQQKKCRKDQTDAFTK